MSLAAFVVNNSIKRITRLLCKIDDQQIRKVPSRGPLILVSNHINFIEVPIIYTHLLPRPVTGFVKSETWDNPLMGALFDIWGGIPLRRGEADVFALRQALKALKNGYLLGITPEGTRSGTGELQRGYPGVVTVALKSGAPLLPVVYYGSELLHTNLRKLKRTDFHIIVGKPYHIDTHGEKLTRHLRQVIVDQIMYQIARLLPPQYRGYYSDLENASEYYLNFNS